jgi:hypothetical protein
MNPNIPARKKMMIPIHRMFAHWEMMEAPMINEAVTIAMDTLLLA